MKPCFTHVNHVKIKKNYTHIHKYINKFIPCFQFFIVCAKRDVEWMCYNKAVKALKNMTSFFSPSFYSQPVYKDISQKGISSKLLN